jgi:hypothetical protein
VDGLVRLARCSPFSLVFGCLHELARQPARDRPDGCFGLRLVACMHAQFWAAMHVRGVCLLASALIWSLPVGGVKLRDTSFHKTTTHYTTSYYNIST